MHNETTLKTGEYGCEFLHKEPKTFEAIFKEECRRDFDSACLKPAITTTFRVAITEESFAPIQRGDNTHLHILFDPDFLFRAATAYSVQQSHFNNFCYQIILRIEVLHNDNFNQTNAPSLFHVTQLLVRRAPVFEKMFTVDEKSGGRAPIEFPLSGKKFSDIVLLLDYVYHPPSFWLNGMTLHNVAIGLLEIM